MHDLPHYTTVPMHRCMAISYVCSWQNKTKPKKKWKINPNLACEETNKENNMEAKTQKHKKEQNRGLLCDRNKETEAERLKLGFLGMSMSAHT